MLLRNLALLTEIGVFECELVVFGDNLLTLARTLTWRAFLQRIDILIG
jgi:hypothetical protein